MSCPFPSFISFRSPGRGCQAASKEVPRGQGKPRAPEWWPESSGRGLDDNFLIEAFSCQVCSFFVVLGRLKLVPEGVGLRPWRSLEVRGSPELQNGGLRALGEAWDDFLIKASCCQVWSRFVLLGRLQVAHGCRLRLEANGWRLVAGGSRLLAGGWVWGLEAR